MKKVLVLTAFLAMLLITACGGEAATNQEEDSGLPVTVYFSPT